LAATTLRSGSRESLASGIDSMRIGAIASPGCSLGSTRARGGATSGTIAARPTIANVTGKLNPSNPSAAKFSQYRRSGADRPKARPPMPAITAMPRPIQPTCSNVNVIRQQSSGSIARNPLMNHPPWPLD
jgi:hypothetical protein